MSKVKAKEENDACVMCNSRRGFGADSASTDPFPRCLDCGAPKPEAPLMLELMGRMKRMFGR